MPAPISVVLPTLNAASELPETLKALVEGLQAGAIRELIVSDGGSTDATRDLADAVGAEVVTGPGGRGGQLRRGVCAARGDWILLLHADTRLSSGWSQAALAHIGTRPGSAGYFRLAFRGGGLPARLVAGWANVRSRLFGLPYGDQGLLVSAATLADVGGVPDIPLMEDVALARALRGRLVQLPATAETSPARYEAEGWMRRGLRNLWTLARYLAGVSPDRLARSYEAGSSSPSRN